MLSNFLLKLLIFGSMNLKVKITFSFLVEIRESSSYKGSWWGESLYPGDPRLDVRPTSATPAQHQPRIGSKTHVCWDGLKGLAQAKIIKQSVILFLLPNILI